MSLPVQLSLFGPQSVHVGHWSPAAGFVVCVLCRRLHGHGMGVWADCDFCPGVVEPAPLWTLGGAETPAAPLPLVASQEAAA